MPADSALIAKEVFREMLVDDGDLCVFPNIACVEVAAFQNRNSHCPEIAGRRRIHERLHVFTILGLVSFDGHLVIPFESMKERHARKAGVLDPGNRANAFQQVAIKAHGARYVVSSQRGR